MAENKSWANATIKNCHWWRDGMSPEEYEEESKYFFEVLANGELKNYKPLWKQNKK